MERLTFHFFCFLSRARGSADSRSKTTRPFSFLRKQEKCLLLNDPSTLDGMHGSNANNRCSKPRLCSMNQSGEFCKHVSCRSDKTVQHEILCTNDRPLHTTHSISSQAMSITFSARKSRESGVLAHTL